MAARPATCVVLAALVAACGCGCGSGAGSGDDFDRRVVEELEPPARLGPPPDMVRYAPLERALVRGLGSDFACVAVPRRSRGEMVVHVTRAAAAEARAIVARVRVRTPVVVRVARRESFAAPRRPPAPPAGEGST